MKLAEISQGWDAFDAAIEAAGGELTEELAQQFDALNLAEKDKIDGYIFVLKALEGECDTLKKLEDEISAKRSAKAKRREWLLARVKAYMQERGADKLQGQVFRFQLVKSGKPPVEVLVPAEQLPDGWCKITRVADKEKLRVALMESPTMSTPWVRLGEPSVSVRIF